MVSSVSDDNCVEWPASLCNFFYINNEFSNLKDKGLSVGEKTNLIVFNNEIRDNSNGTAVKDLSTVYFINNRFHDNEIAINSYQKKQLFGGGSSYMYKNVYKDNKKDFKSDELSNKYDINLSEKKYAYIIDLIEKNK